MLQALSVAATGNTGHEGDVFDWVCASQKTITKTSWKRRVTKVARERFKPHLIGRTNFVGEELPANTRDVDDSLGYPEEGPKKIRDFGFKQKFAVER